MLLLRVWQRSGEGTIRIEQLPRLNADWIAVGETAALLSSGSS
jgi:hypothetical protein